MEKCTTFSDPLKRSLLPPDEKKLPQGIVQIKNHIN